MPRLFFSRNSIPFGLKSIRSPAIQNKTLPDIFFKLGCLYKWICHNLIPRGKNKLLCRSKYRLILYGSKIDFYSFLKVTISGLLHLMLYVVVSPVHRLGQCETSMMELFRHKKSDRLLAFKFFRKNLHHKRLTGFEICLCICESYYPFFIISQYYYDITWKRMLASTKFVWFWYN